MSLKVIPLEIRSSFTEALSLATSARSSLAGLIEVFGDDSARSIGQALPRALY